MSHSRSSRAWWKVSAALGIVVGSLVMAPARDLEPFLSEALRALPVSISFGEIRYDHRQ
jgi:hypothetical protein